MESVPIFGAALTKCLLSHIGNTYFPTFSDSFFVQSIQKIGGGGETDTAYTLSGNMTPKKQPRAEVRQPMRVDAAVN